MSYNLKIKTVIMLALTFAVMMSVQGVSYAEDVAPVPEAQADSLIGADVSSADTTPAEAVVTEAVPEASVAEVAVENVEVPPAVAEGSSETFTAAEVVAPEQSVEVPAEQQAAAENISADLFGETDELFADDVATEAAAGNVAENPVPAPQEVPAVAEEAPVPTDNSDNGELDLQDSSLNNSTIDAELGLNADEEDDLFAEEGTGDEKKEDAIPEAEAPKSPFESFGNAILSKVDNDLFNQMSNIEKQNTLLNLELKREELKNKVASLRMQRLKAKEEAELARRREEEKFKDQEAERQANLLKEQEALRQKEIELEKVRQGKVLNEYMNEMLKMNQQWINKNTELLNRIHDLEEDRKLLIKSFEEQVAQVQHNAIVLQKKAETAVANHTRIVASLNAHINGLKRAISDSEEKLNKLKENNMSNPFAAAAAMAGMGEGAIDMSEEYAIMDITGKGDDIVAKIVNKDGTTFIVHKGSMLRGGEVVTAITDHYVAFENNGVRSFIYTGGTVLDFEPTVAFNNADKLPEEADKVTTSATPAKNVLGNASTNKSAAPASAPAATPNARTSRASSRNRAGRSASFGSGMFVQ